LGFLVCGTILHHDDTRLTVRTIPPPPSTSEDPRAKAYKLVVEHRLDPIQLKAYSNLNELFEILVIKGKAVRIEA
jgi:hypothetical protein